MMSIVERRKTPNKGEHRKDEPRCLSEFWQLHSSTSPLTDYGVPNARKNDAFRGAATAQPAQHRSLDRMPSFDFGHLSATSRGWMEMDGRSHLRPHFDKIHFYVLCI